MKVSRRETFDQLRVDRRQSEIFLQEHIQRLELREDERRRKRSSSEDSSHGGRRRRHDYDGGGRRNQLPQRQPPPIKIPKFKGENDPNLYIEWEQKVDQIFNIHLISDQEQVDLVILEFEDYAMTWWHQMCMDNINQEPPAASWMDIKTLMRTRFVPSYYRREILLKLQRLQQGSMCVNEYFKLMESMLLKVGLQFESEEEKVARFVSDLRREVQDVVELYEYSTLDKILHLALKVESQLKKKQEAKRNTLYNEYYSKTWKGKERKDEKPPSKDHPPRTNSSRTFHENANSYQSSRISSIKCFKCLGYGHIASNCPTKRNMILNPKGEVESEHSSPPSPKSSSSHTSSQSSSENEIKPNEGGLLWLGAC